MRRPFDAALKDLVTRYPQDWLEHLRLPGAESARLIEADLSAVSAQADRVILVEAGDPWLLNVELQAGRDAELPRRMLKYAALLTERHRLPVYSVAVLLRPEADHPGLTGVARIHPPPGGSWIEFGYVKVKVWEEPVERFLQGGLGTLPLAPVAAVQANRLPEVVRSIDARLRSEATPGTAADLWTATYILLGLRYPEGVAAGLLRGVGIMRESSTYQAILEEGREEGVQRGSLSEARTILLRMGTHRFGEPAPEVRARLEAEPSLEHLEELALRLLSASSWQELLS